VAKRGVSYKPTDPDRQFVARCICAGDMTVNEIAEALNITDDTLRKHYRYEITTARALLKGKAVGVIEDALTDGSLDAAKFVLARQAGWTERQALEHTSPDGSMTPTLIERVIVKAQDSDC
jgi:hypothetical protein